MNAERSSGSDAVPVTLAARIDRICDSFEACLEIGQRPRIEDYLSDEVEPARSMLLRELLASELESRQQRGERPARQEYHARFPDHADLITELFGTVKSPVQRPTHRARQTPSRDDADRNLLFGVLALQMDFITREALIAATSTWALDKSKSLAQVLEEQEALSPSRRAMLEPLVDEHLKAHGDDAVKSLAAVGLAGTLHQDLQHVADPDVQKSLARVSTVSGDATVLQPSGAPLPATQRFRILRPHAKGGLGEVFVARDEELHREVALKKIQDLHALDPNSRARFQLEAEITGSLEHPGVVPVYSLGHGPDGRPYYAMRFIKGDRLKDSIVRFHKADAAGRRDPGERALEFRQLLERFIDVCHAIAYAHSRGVIHRDLKPVNVMLGLYGETLVVDWGLAKAMASRPPDVTRIPETTLRPESAADSAPTLMGFALGTPSYMSPEQAEGRLDEVDRRSDVYGLGAILYEILTGQPPFSGSNTAEVLRHVINEPPRRPRELVPSTPSALEAVCLKALAKKAEDRYASASQLASEIERFLADEPLAAYREPYAVRAARWTKRHKTMVTCAAALLVMAVGGLSVGAVLLSQANRRTEEQRRLAQENFEQALLAVNDYFTTVSENRLLNTKLPGLQPLRKELLESALKYYQDFLSQHANDASLRAELASAYFRVGRITAEIGKKEDALQALRKAISLYESLAREHPTQATLRAELARCYTRTGMVHYDLGSPADESLAAYRRAIAIQETLARNHPDNVEFRSDLALSDHKLADKLSQMGQPVEALQHFQRAIELRRSLANADSTSGKYQGELALSLNNLGFLHYKSGQTEKALLCTQESNAILAKLARESPDNVQFQVDLAINTQGLGTLYYDMGQPDKGLPFNQQANAMFEKVARENPAVSDYQRKFATNCSDYANHLIDYHGRIADALQVLERARAIAERLEKENPNFLLNQYTLASIYRGIGKALGKEGKSSEALDTMRKAVAINDKVAHTDSLILYDLACSLALCSDLAEPAEKRHYADQAMEKLRESVTAGWKNITLIKRDVELDALRDREDFQKLVRTLEAEVARDRNGGKP